LIVQGVHGRAGEALQQIVDRTLFDLRWNCGDQVRRLKDRFEYLSAAEAKIQEADRLECEAWNAKPREPRNNRAVKQEIPASQYLATTAPRGTNR
jgi:hypothetical protein